VNENDPFAAVVVTGVGVVDVLELAGAIATVTPERAASELLSTTVPLAVAGSIVGDGDGDGVGGGVAVELMTGVDVDGLDGPGLLPPPLHAARLADASNAVSARMFVCRRMRLSISFDRAKTNARGFVSRLGGAHRTSLPRFYRKSIIVKRARCAHYAQNQTS
jgi:hypothetical protein